MRGRKPKPTQLKLVGGNAGKRRLNTREPNLPRAIPSPPAHLSPAAMVVWGQVTVILDRMRVLTEADVFVLESYAETVVECRKLRAVLAKKGRTQRVRTESGGYMIRQRPEVPMMQNAEQRKRMLEGELGITPVARSRVHATEDDAGQHEDPLARYFGA
jgi:P27 family predicted phage terminase small subunit